MSTPNSPYQVGGSLPAGCPSYVKREADKQLYQQLKKGEFCYVLNSRQMGKSSLRVRTMNRLQAEGIACAAIDITAIGTSKITPEQWYAGVIYSIVSSLNINDDQFNLDTWWETNRLLSNVQRFNKFVEEELFNIISEPLVIFVDEIDSVISLKFPIEDFFALIRSFYNKRADNSDYNRLTFALFGVATPSDFIQDKNRTPFNIGKAINLTGFQPSEVEPLTAGLSPKFDNPQEAIAQILAWTGGQPFLTQKICQLLLILPKPVPPSLEAEWVEEVIRTRIIENWETNDEPEHLKTIRNRLLAHEEQASRLLGLYQKIWQQETILADDSPEQIKLRLSGLVVKTNNHLKIYNPIYRAVFNASWVENELEKLRPYGEAISAWLLSDRKDESRLLHGQSLQDALIWTSGKSLSDFDYQFLNASQKLEQKNTEQDLKAEKESNQLLKNAAKNAKFRIQIGSTILGITLALATLAAIIGQQNIRQVNQQLAIAQTDLLQIQDQLTLSLQTIAESIGDVPMKIARQTGQKPAIIYVTFPPSTENSDRLGVLVITDEGQQWHEINTATREKVIASAQEFRWKVTQIEETNDTDYLASSQQLYQWIINPIKNLLDEQEIDTLVFLLDPKLRFIPLAALHDGKQFLVEQYNIGVMPGLNLTDTRYVDLKNARVLGLGLSDISETPLPIIPLELSAIQNLWPGNYLLDQTSTFGNLEFYRKRNQPQIIHVANHAQFLPANHQVSYLQLWDTKLTLQQIEQLKWHETPIELLVLSSCRTGLGDENFKFGFAGAMIQSGVKSVLGNLWYMSDEATMALMVEFYDRLRKAPIKAEALRQAQLAMLTGTVRIESGNLIGSFGQIPLPPTPVSQEITALSHPYFWAGFTLIGNPW